MRNRDGRYPMPVRCLSIIAVIVFYLTAVGPLRSVVAQEASDSIIPVFTAENWRLDSGGAARMADIPVSGEPFSSAVRIDTLRESVNEWDIQLLATTSRPVAKGDTLLLTYWVRDANGKSLNPDRAGSPAQTEAHFERVKEPYDASLRAGIVASETWAEIQVPFKSEGDFAAGEAKLNFRLGYRPQSIDLAAVDLVDYGPDKPMTDLPNSGSSYAGREPNAPWRAAAEARIDRIRKTDLRVTVVDAHGATVPGIKVSVRMLRHAFIFGSVVDEKYLVGPQAGSADGLKYQEVFKSHFNNATEGLLTWRWWSLPEVRRSDIAAVDWLRQNGITDIHGAHLVWGRWDRVPPEVQARYEAESKTDPAAAKAHLEAEIEAHIVDVTQTLKGKVTSYNAVNEDVDEHYLRDELGPQALVNWFTTAHKSDPAAALYINDYDILAKGGIDHKHQDAYYDRIKYLLDQKAPVDGIGIQGHFGTELTPPETMLRILDRFASLGKPIQVTEFDVDTPDQQLQADFTRDFLTTLFSHPAVNGIVIWGFWNTKDWRENTAMYDDDWTEKPNGKAFDDLVFHRWWTNADGVTNGRGSYATRGFLGYYQVSATAPDGRTVSANVTLAKAGEPAMVILKLP